jgi:hypothetical protein
MAFASYLRQYPGCIGYAGVMARLALAAALALAACKAPADCSAFVACGGDLVGAWSIAGTCSQPTTSPCGARRDVTPSYAGTLTVNADGSYTLDAAVGEHGSASFPAACNSPPPSSCAALDSMKDGVTTTCTGNPSARCDCVIDEPAGNASESGTVTSSGNMVTFAPSGAAATYGGSYCVSGNELRLSLVSGVDPFVVVLGR